MPFPMTEHIVKTKRHTTGYLACGADDAPMLIFVHGWPELSICWRHQLPVFAALGFRCVAPDMRGYGRSSVYRRHEDYAVEHIVPTCSSCWPRSAARRRSGSATTGAARWSGTWRAIIRSDCRRGQPLRAVSRGGLHARKPDAAGGPRGLPGGEYPAGQWDYQFFYEESFDKAAPGFEANIRNMVKALFRKGDPDGVGQAVAHRATVRKDGGWFGGGGGRPTCRAMPTC